MNYSIGRKTQKGYPIVCSSGFFGARVTYAEHYEDALDTVARLQQPSLTWPPSYTPVVADVHPYPCPANGHIITPYLVFGGIFRPGGNVSTYGGAIVAPVVNENFAIYGPWTAGDLVVGAYDLVYSDGEGNTSTVVGGFVVSAAI